MNNQALRILLNYKRFSRKTNSFYQPTPEEFEIGKNAGLLFEPIIISHDKAIDWLLEVRDKVSKEQVTASFLASLSSNRLDWRSGLPAYVLSRHFPVHTYAKKNSKNTCPICGDYIFGDEQEVDLSAYNSLRFSSGGAMVGDDIFDVSLVAFYLEQQNKLPYLQPVKADISILKAIVNLIKASAETDTPNDLEKSLAAQKLFKSNHWQRRYLLETLGFCNIIENPEENGYRSEFVLPYRRYKDNHISEWNYPIRLWQGKHGVNMEALKYWFGEYVDL